MTTSSTNPNIVLIDPIEEMKKEAQRTRQQMLQREEEYHKSVALAKQKKEEEARQKAAEAESTRIAEEAAALRKVEEDAAAETQRQIDIKNEEIKGHVIAGLIATASILIFIFILVPLMIVKVCLRAAFMAIGLKVGGDIWNSSLRK